MRPTFGQFTKEVETLAQKGKVRIAFGLAAPDEEILASLRSVSNYADITLVGPKAIEGTPNFQVSVDEDPGAKIAALLVRKEIEGMIRGTIDDFKTYESFMRLSGEKETINPALLETPTGAQFFMSPASNPEGWEKEERLYIAEEIAKFVKSWQIDPLIAVYTGVRHDTFAQRKGMGEGITAILNKTYVDAEWIVAELKRKGYTAKNYAIDLNVAVDEGYNIHIPVNGMVGNQIFRVVLFCGGKMLAAPRLGLSYCYEDNSRTEKDFAFHVKWLAAWINARRSEA